VFKHTRFLDFITSKLGGWGWPPEKGVRVIVPEIGWVPGVVRDARGQAARRDGRRHVVFLNGRHRTAWMRDNGASALPVIVDVEQAEVIAAEIGTTERATTVTLPALGLDGDPDSAANALGCVVMIARAGQRRLTTEVAR
jgi:hypothetical protein